MLCTTTAKIFTGRSWKTTLPRFSEVVSSGFESVPHIPEFNAVAYKKIEITLNALERQRSDWHQRRRAAGVDSGADDSLKGTSQGIVILGESGSGKTHLLSNVVHNRAAKNQVLIVPVPTNPRAVAQHIWFYVLESLTRILDKGKIRNQLDDMLANVFADILVTVFDRDIADGINVRENQQRAVKLRADPYNLFTLVGEGAVRIKNLKAIRMKTMKYLTDNLPGVDSEIARVLVTYCLTNDRTRRQKYLDWLKGRDLLEEDVKGLGLSTSWVTFDDAAKDNDVMRQREKRAHDALITVAILSTHYRPLILAFDQLEFFNGNKELTSAWGNEVRELCDHAPNMLIVTFLFPDLWREWFLESVPALPERRGPHRQADN